MIRVPFTGASRRAALHYFVFILCICAFLFVFLITRIADALNPEIYYDPPTVPVYRAVGPLLHPPFTNQFAASPAAWEAHLPIPHVPAA